MQQLNFKKDRIYGKPVKMFRIKDMLFYVSLPYSYNPDEAYEFALLYRNLLVGLDIFSYSPILETHNAHVRYSELMTLNMADEDEIKEFEKNMYGFYIEEDLFKMDFLNNSVERVFCKKCVNTNNWKFS